jgi:reverse gyrase
MARQLVIVESPAKARTINKILGSEFDVTSSMGHLRDLPASKLGVDVEKDFEPHYIVIYKRRKFAKELQEQARGRDVIYLAPDPDREGRLVIAQQLGQMPADGFTFPVRIGGKVNSFLAFGELLKMRDGFSSSHHNNILGLKTVIHIEAHTAAW